MIIVKKKEDIQDWLIGKIVKLTQLKEHEISVEDSFAKFGIDSANAIALTKELEYFLDVQLSPTLIWNYPSIDALSAYLSQTAKADEKSCQPNDSCSCEQEQKGYAIVGVGCHFPNAGSPEEFWNLLINGKEGISSRSFGEKEISGGYIRSAEMFDNEFFNISPREAKLMDPQHRLLLKTTWKAIEDAGIDVKSIDGGNVGVYIGISSNEYSNIAKCVSENDLFHAVTGNSYAIAANRLSYYYNLRGPSVSIDTACSSSLVAVHMACKALKDGDCKLAIVGGVNLIINSEVTSAFQKAGMLSPDGRCKTFDSSADGYVRGEGVGVILIKSLQDAISENNSVYAVILGSAINQDGRTNGITAPNKDAQIDVIRRALINAETTPDSIQYVEAHGTGTSLGDPIEAQALGESIGVYKDKSDKLRIGSVKTNIGHLEAAAGIAGIIKLALALKNHTLVKNLHYKSINPLIPLDDYRLCVQENTEEWLPNNNGTRVAGISSFGFGGTNAHIILADMPRISASDHLPPENNEKYYIFPLSGHTQKSLMQQIRSVGLLLKENPDISMHMLSNGLGVHHSHFKRRIAVVQNSKDQLIKAIENASSGVSREDLFTHNITDSYTPKIAFVFSGQGPGTLSWRKELFENEAFMSKLIECDELYMRLGNWSIVDVLQYHESESIFEKTSVSQPVIFAIQISLAHLLHTWGIVPVAVVGHSLGEIACACFSGRISLGDAIKIVYNRSNIMEGLYNKGKMCSILASVDEVGEAILKQGLETAVKIATINSENNVIVSGTAEGVEKIKSALEASGIICKLLGVKYPFHSFDAKNLSAQLKESLRGIRLMPPKIASYSTMTGEESNLWTFTADYWSQQIYEPVKFSQATRNLLSIGVSYFLEISPSPLLLSNILYTVQSQNRTAVVRPILKKNQNQEKCLLEVAADLYANGKDIVWNRTQEANSPYCKVPYQGWEERIIWLDQNRMAGQGEQKTPIALNELRPTEIEADPLSTPSSYDETLGDSPFLLHRDLPGADKHSAILSYLKNQIAEELLIDDDAIDLDRSLAEYGIDSIMAVSLKMRIDATFRINFPIKDIMSGVSLNGIVETIITTIASNQNNFDMNTHSQTANEEPGAASSKSKNEKYTVEQLLGDSRERYFGHGHRGTRYEVSDTYWDHDRLCMHAKVVQTVSWSSKSDVQMNRHLSTIDGLILAAKAVEAYIIESQSSIVKNIKCLMLTQFEIKAGISATEDLEKVLISVQQLGVLDAGDKLAATVFVGTLKVTLEFSEIIPEKRQQPNSGSAETLEYIDSHLRFHAQDIVNIEIDTEKHMTSCDIVNLDTMPDQRYSSIQCAHQDKVSLIEWVISLSQLAQILAYSHDDIDRSQSENFWMRSIKGVYNGNSAYLLGDKVSFVGRIRRSELLPIGDHLWRSFVMEGSDVADSIQFVAQVAHRLPEINEEQKHLMNSFS
jgi:acyl transferase domain-containing protein